MHGLYIVRSPCRTTRTTTSALLPLQLSTIPGQLHDTGFAVAGASCSSKPPASIRSPPHSIALVGVLPLLDSHRW